MRWKKYAIVDDNKFDRLICSKILLRICSEVDIQEFQTGKEILDHLFETENDGEPLLILLDLNMPEMNGYEFLEAIKGDPLMNLRMRRVDIVIVTSSTRNEDRERAMAFPYVEGFLQKPLMIPQMQELLSDASEKSED